MLAGRLAVAWAHAPAVGAGGRAQRSKRVRPAAAAATPGGSFTPRKTLPRARGPSSAALRALGRRLPRWCRAESSAKGRGPRTPPAKLNSETMASRVLRVLVAALCAAARAGATRTVAPADLAPAGALTPSAGAADAGVIASPRPITTGVFDGAVVPTPQGPLVSGDIHAATGDWREDCGCPALAPALPCAALGAGTPHSRARAL